MSKGIKTALCAFILALALLSAYIQEVTWTGDRLPEGQTQPAATEFFLDGRA